MAGSLKLLMKALSAGAFLGASYLYLENNLLEVHHHFMHTERGEGIRIMQLSDLHDKEFGKDNKRLLKKIREINPDLILISGDTVSSGGQNLQRTCAFLKLLTNKYPVCGILGNHEQRKNEEFITDEIRKAGVKLLKNQQTAITIKGVTVNILGLCEKQAIVRSDYIKAFFRTLKYENHDRELERLEESEGIRILLSHFPENYALTKNCSYNRFSFELMLSGHAHGGHIRLPYVGGIYAPGQGFFPMYQKGLYRGRNNALLVSGGLGNDSPLPRMNNIPSLDVVDFI